MKKINFPNLKSSNVWKGDAMSLDELWIQS